jgi:hypothetical protein
MLADPKLTQASVRKLSSPVLMGDPSVTTHEGGWTDSRSPSNVMIHRRVSEAKRIPRTTNHSYGLTMNSSSFLNPETSPNETTSSFEFELPKFHHRIIAPGRGAYSIISSMEKFAPR